MPEPSSRPPEACPSAIPLTATAAAADRVSLAPRAAAAAVAAAAAADHASSAPFPDRTPLAPLPDRAPSAPFPDRATSASASDRMSPTSADAPATDMAQSTHAAAASALPTDHPDAPKSERPNPRTGTSREPLWRDVVGEVLREVRQTKHRTLQDVADVARISMPYLSEIERGRKEASSEMLAAATRALGISMTELLVRVQVRLVEYERAAATSATLALGAPQFSRAATSTVTAATTVAATGVGTATGLQSRDALCLAA